MRKITFEKIKEVSDLIAKKFRPEKIILFGSFVWGKPDKNSDVDFFIIKKTNRSLRFLAREIDGFIFPRPFPIDLIVCTPEKVEKRKKMGDFFIKEILNKGKVLYAKKKKRK